MKRTFALTLELDTDAPVDPLYQRNTPGIDLGEDALHTQLNGILECARNLRVMCVKEIEPEQDGPNDDAFREAASNQADDDLSFDEGAVVSESEDGAWVAAWVWVSNSAAGVS